jgi:hypothetical protein
LNYLTNKYEYESIRTYCFHIIFDINDEGWVYQKIDEWNEEIFNEIPFFALGKKRALEISSEFGPRKATRDGMDLLYKVKEIKEANEYFISADKDVEDRYLKRGEFGELILYYLLERQFNKPQLISKIYFKDSPSGMVHGFDAVHYDKEKNELWIGESKFYKSLSNALQDLANDLFEHFNVNFFDSEFAIINNRLSDYYDDKEVSDEIRELIKSSTFIQRLSNINACFFALFDSKILDNFKFNDSGNTHNDFKDILEKFAKDTRKKFDQKIKDFGNKDRLKINLFLFPVESKFRLVKQLHEKLKKEQN